MVILYYSPTDDSLLYVLRRDGKNADPFALSILRFWSQEHEDKLAELVTMQLTRHTTTPRKQRLRDKYVTFLYHIE